MSHIAFFNGAWVDSRQPGLRFQDLGLLRGYGIFDFLNVLDGKPIFLQDHLKRFERSARLMNLALPMDGSELSRVLEELLRKNGEPDAAFRLILTGGYSDNAYRPTTPNLLILQQAYGEPAPEMFEKGIALITTPFRRELPEIKTTNYINGIRLLPRLQREGAFEPLYHDHGYVRESVRSNFFLVDAAGRLLTPNRLILPGITRSKVLELAADKVEVNTRAVRLREIDHAREAFITGTRKKVLPVVQIDGKPIGNGRPGPLTRALMADFDQLRRPD